ncbi:MAG TPA: glycosyltransferase family 9 protein [Nitrospirae bacterium]|nr:glycosyltransferase family 9 protein [Nitrospirota bacterium]
MIYILLTYLLYPFIYLIILLKRKKGFERILVIQTAKIGDMICSTPVFREIKKRYPSAHLTLLIDPVTKGVIEKNPHIDKITTIRTKDFKGLAGKVRLSGLIRKGNYDAAVCLNPNVPYALSLFWGLVPLRISVMPDFAGITFKLAAVFFTHLEKHVRGKMVIETYMQMLRKIGVESSDISKDVYMSEGADIMVRDLLGSIGKPLTGIAISSGNKMKEMEAEKITALVNKLLDNTGTYIALIGSGQDRDKAESLCGSFSHKERVINTVGKFSLTELPALLKRLSLFIGVDSGITYMADALSVPLINVAGPADMQDQRPTNEYAIIMREKIPCVPCSHAFRSPYSCRLKTRECITSVSVEEIFSAANKILLKPN